MSFEEIRKLVFKEYVKNGYFEKWQKAKKILAEHGIHGIVELAEVGLFVTEIAEAMEEIRNGNKGKEVVEHADTIIRLMNYCTANGLNIEEAIMKKHLKNMKREKLHGRNII